MMAEHRYLLKHNELMMTEEESGPNMFQSTKFLEFITYAKNWELLPFGLETL